MADKREVQIQLERLGEIAKIQKQWPPEFENWKSQTERIVSKTFGANSLQLQQFKQIGNEGFVVGSSTPPSYYENAYRTEIKKLGLMLQSFAEELSSHPNVETEIQTCPKCDSVNPEFIEIRDIEMTDIGGGIHGFISGKRTTIKPMAFFRCKHCGIVFSVETTKVQK